MSTAWQLAAEAAIGEKFVSLTGLSGGDFATAYRGRLASGCTVFVKTHANPPAGFFGTEAAGLKWLKETQTVNIPDVLATEDEPPYLVMRWVEQGTGQSGTERALGRQLAALHQQPQPLFGRSDAATTGSLAVPNQPLPAWCEFYATQRLLPLISRAEERQSLPVSVLSKVERIAGKLGNYDVPDEPPALLHGDLWAGNRLVDDNGASWLIDPAAHCGHREFDLGMMALFGGFDDDCFAAYHEAYPLTTGWQQRLQLHQLAPLLVHAIKFGGSYCSAVRDVAKKFA